MLHELQIKNFAIIEELSLQFQPGLVIFTGETGAGKSILIDAVEALIGGRTELAQVRSGEERAIIEGEFLLHGEAALVIQAILDREDLLDDPARISLSREIRQNGRSVARVNGRSVNSSLLREIGELLVDIHGQSEHLTLLHVPHHIRLLDAYAGSGETLTAYRKIYRNLQDIRRQHKALLQIEKESARRIDMLTYQIQEIDTAQLKPGEEASLIDERNRLGNAEGLAKLTQEALNTLDAERPESTSTIDLLGQVVHSINSLVRLDPAQASIVDQAQFLFDQTNELAINLRRYLETVEYNPRRLDQVEERLGLIHTLKKKYSDSLDGVIKYAENARIELEEISHATEKIEQLEKQEQEEQEKLAAIGCELTSRRQHMAEKLAQAIEAELEDLQMSRARFQVSIVQKEDPQGIQIECGVVPGNKHGVAFDANGFEDVEFMIAPNPGEGFKPLVKVASGGETSRLMLALKNVLASADQVPNLIFDEIDQGIGGRVGGVVGQKLWNLARKHQVFCVTHLPQLAAYGDQHFYVHKEIDGDRTLTRVDDLSGEIRIRELAQMFGEISEGTIQSARELLSVVTQKIKNDSIKDSL